MCHKESTVGQIAKASSLCLFPLMCRDLTFRSILLGSYYATTSVEHKPALKYSVPQITDFMKQRRARLGDQAETVTDLSHLFYEFHSYEIKTKVTTRLTALILGNMIATLITNPFDVVLSKLATQ